MQNRIERLREFINPDTSLLVSDLTNIRYLSGFTGSNGLLLVSPSESLLVTDARYDEQSKQECPYVDVEISSNLFKSASGRLSTQTLAIEGQHLSVNHWKRLTSENEQVTIAGPWIEILRSVKDQSEITLISKACEISTRALAAIQDQISVGMSERHIAKILDATMLDFGAEAIAFSTIVASGPNSAIPHHQPTDRLIKKGDFLKIDFGALFAGYHADCTRTFVVGNPADWQTDLHDTLLESQQNAVSKLAPGVDFEAVVKAAKAPLETAGLLDKFIHGLGHGVGLEIHEQPFLSNLNGGKIEENMVVTIEPGVYLPDVGGIRIEDTVMVTSLASENLTKFTYELTSVG